MNTRNPLLRLRLSCLFPLLNRIDDGTEKRSLPHRLANVPGMVMQPMLPLENWLERSRLRI